MSVDRPHMLPEEFDELARIAPRAVEGIRLEFLGGRLRVKPWADGNHGCVREWLTRLFLRERPDLFLHGQGLKVQEDRCGRALPDGVLAPSEGFVGQGEWAEAGNVLMAVEVTLYDVDADRHARVDKPGAYAGAGIPVFLLIDRDGAEVKVYSQPDGVRYETVRILPFGKTVDLPEPVGISLDTEPLKNWVR